MPTVRLEIEYDGSGFRGWARQAGLRTVQGELETALATVLREPVGLTVAGRTDTGVHALGQVASFVCAAEPTEQRAKRLNGVGPRDVTVVAATIAPRDSTRAATRARAAIATGSSPAPRRAPSSAAGHSGCASRWIATLWTACAEALPGRHDFTAFTPTQTDHVRFERDIFAASWSKQGDILSFEVTADAFMRNMVRVLVGTMLDVSAGNRTIDNFKQLLQGAPRSAAGETAPPQALYLESVSY